MKRIYLDYAATTPAAPAVVEAMLPFFSGVFGNPSSTHAFGKEARDAVEKARETLAHFIGAKPQEIVFTSGGTESNNTALKGIALANRNRGNHIITSSIEHHSITESCAFLEKNGFSVTYLPVDREGFVSPDEVRKHISRKTILLSLMHANNEIGTLQPIAEIASIAKAEGIYFHTDAVQTFGHLPVEVESLHLDLLSVSAHKLYGPKGVGALYVRSGTRISPFLHGGTQERGRRASTHNVPGIVGFVKAVEIARADAFNEGKRLVPMRDRLIRGILERVRHACLNGHPSKRLPGNVNVSFRGVEGELVLLSLDKKGIACSTGSACSAESTGPSHVLLALGLPHDLVAGSLRLTLGKFTREEEIDSVLEVLPAVVEEIRSLSFFEA